MFCKGKGSKIKTLFKKISDAVQKHASTALVITGDIRKFLEDPMVAISVSLTKTKIDDQIRDKAIAALGVAIDALSMVDECAKVTDVELKLMCFVSHLRKYQPGVQQAILIKLASLITATLDGHTEKQRIYDALVQGSYTLDK